MKPSTTDLALTVHPEKNLQILVKIATDPHGYNCQDYPEPMLCGRIHGLGRRGREMLNASVGKENRRAGSL